MNKITTNLISKIFEDALKIGSALHPTGTDRQHESFSNAVVFFCTGVANNPRGINPSCRQLTAERMGAKIKNMGEWTFDEAVDFCEKPIYGELTDQHIDIFDEHQGKHDYLIESLEDLEIIQKKSRYLKF